MPVAIAYVLGILAALAATIVAFIMIVPDKKRAGLNKFFQWVHDFFNFKSLWLEKILKFLYIFETLACIGIGFFMLFSVQSDYWHNTYMGGVGILLMLLGPVVVRILYEFIMLAILQVKNTIDINNKLIAQEGSVADQQAKEAQRKAEEEARLAEQRAAQMAYQQQYQQQYAQPVQPQYGQPVQPQYAQPVQQYTQPAQPQYTQPAQPQYTQPAQPQYTQPVQEQYTQPVQEQPAQEPEQNQ